MTGVSPWVLAVLVAALAASWLVLQSLMGRWTLGRRRSRLVEWARAEGLAPTDELPESFATLLGPLGAWHMIAGFSSGSCFYACLRATRTPASADAENASTWIFAGQQCPSAPPMEFAALRPAGRTTSLVDILAADSHPVVWSYPSIDTADGFTIFAGSPADAGALANSLLPARLPDDLGLLIARGWLILDLSDRRLDEIEAAAALRLLHALTETVSPASPHA